MRSNKHQTLDGIKRTVVFGAFFVCLVGGHAYSFKARLDAEIPAAYHERLQAAFAYGLIGDLERSLALFEDLHKNHPGEMTVADFYAQTLERAGRYREAAKILVRWLKHEGPKSDIHSAQVKQWIGRLKEKDDFASEIEAGELRQRYASSGSERFIVHSNIPEDYQTEILDLLSRLLEEEKALLSERFGITLDKVPAVKVFVVGRREDFDKLRSRFGWDIHAVLHKAFYITGEQSIVIFFDGEINEAEIAHELAHHLISHYAPSASLLLHEGLAEYLAFETTKDASQKEISERLEFINWFYEQGGWQRAFEVIEVWTQYERLREKNVESDPLKFLAYNDLNTLFYVQSWMMVHFFAEAQDQDFRELFLKYIDYERRNPVNNAASAADFFNEKLETAQDIERFDDAWGRHSVNLTYEAV